MPKWDERMDQLETILCTVTDQETYPPGQSAYTLCHRGDDATIEEFERASELQLRLYVEHQSERIAYRAKRQAQTIAVQRAEADKHDVQAAMKQVFIWSAIGLPLTQTIFHLDLVSLAILAALSWLILVLFDVRCERLGATISGKPGTSSVAWAGCTFFWITFGLIYVFVGVGVSDVIGDAMRGFVSLLVSMGG